MSDTHDQDTTRRLLPWTREQHDAECGNGGCPGWEFHQMRLAWVPVPTSMSEPERVSSCPCCEDEQDGEFRDLCDTCATAALAGRYPHGCQATAPTVETAPAGLTSRYGVLSEAIDALDEVGTPSHYLAVLREMRDEEQP